MEKFNPADHDVDYLVDTMPSDPDLFEPLGQIAWAAIRFGAGIRDHLLIYVEPGFNPYKLDLGKALTKLHGFADRADDTEMVAWIDNVARPANEQRSRVIHASAFTADDGMQAIAPWREYADGRLLKPELRQVVAQLVHANATMPQRPYTWTS